MAIDDSENITATNERSFYMEICILKLDRISLLCIIANLQLALRHPNMPLTTRDQTREIGKSLALRLIGDGITLPDNVMENWYKTFGIVPDKGLSTVQEN